MRITHAMPRAPRQSMHTGEWDDTRTLCGLTMPEVSSASVYSRYVTCPECRADTGFRLLPVQEDGASDPPLPEDGQR